jgi:trehalose-6-phosphate synthase
VLGVHATPRGVRHGGRFTHVLVAPCGVDGAPFRRALAGRAAAARLAAARAQFADGRVVLLAVDALVPQAGLQPKLDALDALWAAHPDTAARVALVQVALPPRARCLVGDTADALAGCLQRAVGRINGAHAALAAGAGAAAAVAWWAWRTRLGARSRSCRTTRGASSPA